MVLTHPLAKPANLKAIEKYKDRIVTVKHGAYGMWMGKNCWVSSDKPIAKITFKQALKLTKHYKPESKIEYHFEDELGTSVLSITDFEPEEIYSFPNIHFDNIQQERLANVNENQRHHNTYNNGK